MGKVCKRCEDELDEENRYRHNLLCVTCGKTIERERSRYRQLNDRKFYMIKKYTAMRQRQLGTGVHNSNAEGKPILSWDEFWSWYEDTKDIFEKMFSNYIESGEDTRLAPLYKDGEEIIRIGYIGDDNMDFYDDRKEPEPETEGVERELMHPKDERLVELAIDYGKMYKSVHYLEGEKSRLLRTEDRLNQALASIDHLTSELKHAKDRANNWYDNYRAVSKRYENYRKKHSPKKTKKTTKKK